MDIVLLCKDSPQSPWAKTCPEHHPEERELPDSETRNPLPFMEKQGSIFNIYLFLIFLTGFGLLWRGFLFCKIGSWNLRGDLNWIECIFTRSGWNCVQPQTFLCDPQHCIPEKTPRILKQWPQILRCCFSSQLPGRISSLSSIYICVCFTGAKRNEEAGKAKIIKDPNRRRGLCWTCSSFEATWAIPCKNKGIL